MCKLLGLAFFSLSVIPWKSIQLVCIDSTCLFIAEFLSIVHKYIFQ